MKIQYQFVNFIEKIRDAIKGNKTYDRQNAIAGYDKL